MKLKLETHDSVTVLVVTEAIPLQQAQVLRAGLGKLIDSGKAPIVIDLTQLKAADLTDALAIAEVASLPGWALEKKAQVLIASAQPHLGQAPSRAEAIALLSSPSAALLARESQLQARRTVLMAQKAALEKQLSLAPPGSDPKVIQKETSDLARAFGVMRLEIESLMLAPEGSSTAPAPYSSEAMIARRVTLYKTITTVLTQQGILPK